MRLYILILVAGLLSIARPDFATGAVKGDAQEISLSPLVTRLLNDPVILPDERQRLRLFHGQWEGLDSLSDDRRAQLALWQYDINHALFNNIGIDPLLRAEAAILAGHPERILELLHDWDSIPASLLLARAHEQQGELAKAAAKLIPVRARLQEETIDNAQDLCAAARALIMLARLEGRPAQDWHTAMELLSTVRDDLDPLYWPARIAEADFLLEKNNRKEAVIALLEALSLNPNCSEAWYRLGILASEGFDFDQAAQVAKKLRAIHSDHLLADFVDIRSYLTQRDIDAAHTIAVRAMKRFPTHRELLALWAAIVALQFDDAATRAALQQSDKLAPGSPLAYHTAGLYLSIARQYPSAERMLREAIERQPNAAPPRIDLGLLLVQAGRLEAARPELAKAAHLDPFHRRAANSLRMVEDLLSYSVIETEHFIIRHPGGIDEVLARDMPLVLEQIYEDITSIFEHKLPFKTQIDILPDEKYFGVRITGTPEIWTIAAATGPAIGLTPPREGAKQRGNFDWANVIRHEFVHTVTLDKTQSRLPHWFTEACAVSQELTGRTFETCELLAWALTEDKLFDYEQINWGFVRPADSTQRPLAYAQADWMLEFIAFKYGHNAVIEMLARYREGMSDADVLADITGLDPPCFMESFRRWAIQQVEQWGLAEAQQPHRAQLRTLAEAALISGDSAAARQAVLQYANACPVDIWPHMAMVQLELDTSGDIGPEVIPSLEQLDQQEQTSGDWAYQLSRIFARHGPKNRAADAIERALQREPYNATYREESARIWLWIGNLPRALHHLESTALLEPNRAQHHLRLAAMYHRLDRIPEAKAAAQRARDIDPESPVDQFLRQD